MIERDFDNKEEWKATTCNPQQHYHQQQSAVPAAAGVGKKVVTAAAVATTAAASSSNQQKPVASSRKKQKQVAAEKRLSINDHKKYIDIYETDKTNFILIIFGLDVFNYCIRGLHFTLG